MLGVVAGVVITLCLSQVEFCKSFGDPTKPRAWSKHAQKPSQSKPPPKDKDAVSTEAKKVRGRSLPAISRVSAERSAREGRVVGGRGAQESLLDGSRKQPSQGSGVPSPFICDPHACVFCLQDYKKKKVVGELEKVGLSW